MSYIPPRPTGDDEEARGIQSMWDILWGGESIFIDNEAGALRFEKQANGKYIAKLRKRPSGSGGSDNSLPVWL